MSSDYFVKAQKRKRLRTALGCAAFFLLVAGIVTVALFVYGALEGAGLSVGTVALIMLCVIIFLAAFCTVFDYVRRSLTVDKPVGMILQATDAIAKGDFSVRLNSRHLFRRYDEYDFIMENLNKMAAELSRSEVLKSDFVSNVSHEFKTPLTVIHSYAGLIAPEKDENKRAEYAEVLKTTAKRLTALVTNILTLNKLENQAIKQELSAERLDEMLESAVLNFEDAIEKKNLSVEFDAEPIEIFTNRDYLELVWNNLLSNAVKFTPEGGTIGVKATEKGGKARVEIRDTGCGINAQSGAHIFDKFYQGDTSHAKEGNGLGLALVKKVIDILGGEIDVESEQDKGSVFTVTLAAGKAGKNAEEAQL